MQNICRFFEDEEMLKGRHILSESYKAILKPNSQDASLRTLKGTNLCTISVYTTETRSKMEINIKSKYIFWENLKKKINYTKGEKVAQYVLQDVVSRQIIFPGRTIRHSKTSDHRKTLLIMTFLTKLSVATSPGIDS